MSVTTIKSACRTCGSKWIFLSGDRHCPMCGGKIPFVQFSLEKRTHLFEDYPQSDISVPVAVENVHTEDITLLDITSQPPCFSADPGIKEVVIKPGDQAKGILRYSPSKLQGQKRFPLKVKISLLSTVGSHRHEDSVALQVHGAPSVEIEPTSILVPGEDSERNFSKQLNLRMNSSAKKFCSGSRCSDDLEWLDGVDIDFDSELMTVSINPSKLSPGSEEVGAVSIWIQEHPDLELGFTVLKTPLQFTMTRHTVPSRQVMWLGLPYKNVSSKPLSIHSARVSRVRLDGEDVTFNDDRIRLEHELDRGPIPLAAGEERKKGRDFRLKIDSFLLAPGSYGITLAFGQSPEEEEWMSSTFIVDVAELKEYEGIVAIDFGTCNTSTAYMDYSDFRPRMVPIGDPEGNKDIMGSAVAVRGSDETVLGSEARVLDGHVTLLKLALGEDASIIGEETAKDLTLRLMREVIWKTERHLNQRVKRLVVSYPSRFSNRQINDLRYVLHELKTSGIIDACYMIDEASAAALSFIMGHKEEEDYSLFVFDFGGGTIDMSYCDVKHLRNGTKRVELRNMGGLRRFGGEDINSLLMEIIAENVKDHLIEERGGTLLREDIWIATSRDDVLANKAGLDKKTLRGAEKRLRGHMEAVENLKIVLCETHDEDLSGSQKLKRKWDAYIRREQRVDVSLEVTITYEQFAQKMRIKMDQAIEVMKRIVSHAKGNSTTGPDHIVLAGGSSRIPVVKEKIEQEEAFLHTETRLAQHLKECVALGACEYGIQKILPGHDPIEFGDSFAGETRSSFGFVIYTPQGPRLKRVIQKGESLPAERRIPELKGSVKAGQQFVLYEDFGEGGDLEPINQPDMERLDAFVLSSKDLRGFSAGELAEAEVVLKVKRDESLVLELIIADKSIQFSTKERAMHASPCES